MIGRIYLEKGLLSTEIAHRMQSHRWEQKLPQRHVFSQHVSLCQLHGGQGSADFVDGKDAAREGKEHSLVVLGPRVKADAPGIVGHFEPQRGRQQVPQVRVHVRVLGFGRTLRGVKKGKNQEETKGCSCKHKMALREF